MSQEQPMAENSPGTPNPEEIVRQMTKRFPHASSAQLLDIIRTKHPDLEMNSEVYHQCIQRHGIGAQEPEGMSYGMRAVIWALISLILLLGVVLVEGLDGIGLIRIPIAGLGLMYAIVGFAKDEKPGAAFCGLMTSGIVLLQFTWELIIATA